MIFGWQARGKILHKTSGGGERARAYSPRNNILCNAHALSLSFSYALCHRHVVLCAVHPIKKSRAGPPLYMRCLLPRRLRVLGESREAHRSEKQIMRNHIQKGVQHLKIEATWTHTHKRRKAESGFCMEKERERKRKRLSSAGFSFRATQNRVAKFFPQKSRTQTHTTSSVFFFLLFSGIEKACVGNRQRTKV